MAYYNEIRYIAFSAGTSIEEACAEALEVALSNNCIIKFNFNGVEMQISPILIPETFGEKVIELVHRYQQKIKLKCTVYNTEN